MTTHKELSIKRRSLILLVKAPYYFIKFIYLLRDDMSRLWWTVPEIYNFYNVKMRELLFIKREQ